MAKSFRRFREDSYDDEWGDNDDYEQRKRNKLKERKQKQRQKAREKRDLFDERDIDV